MENQDELVTMSQGQHTVPYIAHEPTVLGEQLGIPFTVANMQNAKVIMDSLQITPPNPINVRTTHKYIKFFPVTVDDVTALENSDSSIYFSEEPFEYERVVQGGWYREPGLSNDQLTPLYASVPVDYVVPNGINHTVIEELYLPDEDMILIGGTNPSMATMDYINDLMYHAHDLVEHPDKFHFLPNTGPYFEDGLGPIYTTPHGTIRVYDTRLEANIPLEGVRIKAVKHGGYGSVRNGITNELGRYYLDGYQSHGSTNYTIIFETPKFAIHRSGVSAWVDLIGTSARKQVLDQSRHSFSYNISTGESEHYDNMIAHMFRASYRYYNGDIDGLKRPYRPAPNIQRLVAVNGTESWAGINYIVFPVLKVARYEAASSFYDSDEYYGITIHELAHTAHVLTMNNPINFGDVSLQIIESWAVACQWHITNLEYRSRGITDYGNEEYFVDGLRRPHVYAYQYWNTTSHSTDYTSLFINLFDDFNELGESFGWRTGVVNDQVSGYNLGTIQSVFLKHCYSHSSLSTQLKANKPAGVTNAQIDLLLSFY